jgi:tetratricopeptide (TPR) repeat protein
VAAAAALNGTSLAEARQLLEALASSHLIEWAGRGRYRIHDLLHLYTRELVRAAADEAENATVVRRLFDWYLYSAANSNRALEPVQGAVWVPIGSPPAGCRPVEFVDEKAASEWLATESATLIDVVRYAAELGYDEHVWQIVSAVSNLIQYGPQISEWNVAKVLAVEAAKRQGDIDAQMWSTHALGYAYMYAGYFDQALRCFTDCLHYSSADGAGRPRARLLEIGVLNGSAHILRVKGELAKATECATRALSLMQYEDDPNSEVWALGIMGMICRDQGDAVGAETLLREALAKRPVTGWTQALLDHNLLTFMGQVKQSLGQSEQAVVYFSQALNIVQGLANPLGEVRVLHVLMQALRRLGRVDEVNTCERLTAELVEKFSISAVVLEEFVEDYPATA